MKAPRDGRPVLSYSLRPLLHIATIFLVLFLFGGFYYGYIWSDPFPLLIFLALWTPGVYYLWTRPLRRIRFYEDHFEVSGWKTHLKAEYAQVEDLSQVRRVIGDFRSNGTLWFSVRGNPNVFTMPNRTFGKPKVELYSWLLKKNPEASTST